MNYNEVNRLFVEPNAYINFNNIEKKERKKVVFSEPYETMSGFHIKNDFKPVKDINSQQNKGSSMPFLKGLDLKQILPLAQIFLNKDNNMDLSKIINLFDGNNGGNLISNLTSNPELIKMVTNFFNFKSQNKVATKMKSTDFEIKDYTRVQ